MTKAKKFLNIALKVVTWILVAFTIGMMIFTIWSVTMLDENEREIFGYRFYIVQTDSMSPSENNKDMKTHFNAGDIVIIKSLRDKEQYNLKPGDIIAFISMNPEDEMGYYPPYGSTITHMIREATYDENGTLLGYVTFGTNTGSDDPALVEPSYVLGVYRGKLPGVGKFFAFTKTTPGYIVCILVPFILLILYNGVNVVRLFRQYRKEQLADMQAERERLDAERAENQRMMQELLELKAQLTNQKAKEETPPDAPATEENSQSSQSEEI